MSTKTKTTKKKSCKKSPASPKKKAVKSTAKKSTTKKPQTKKSTIKPVLPPVKECYCDKLNEDTVDSFYEEYGSADKYTNDELNYKYYYAINHTSKIKALIIGEALPYDYAMTVAERVTEDTSNPEEDNIHLAEVGYVLYWILKKIFKVREYEL